ncbi:MAG: hypothetical protein P4L87_20580 [Formivibrio sp.]|nr:hypothetical protein [Formivibrio sp.]
MPLLYKVIAFALGLIFVFGGVSFIVSGHFIGGIIIIGLVGLIFYFIIKGENKLTALLAEINQRHSTLFNRDNGFGMGSCIFFDSENRKVLLTNGKDSRMEDFSFIRSWELKWIEKCNLRTGSISYEKVRIEIQTNDYNSPFIKFSLFSKTQGDFWLARLNILLG